MHISEELKYKLELYDETMLLLEEEEEDVCKHLRCYEENYLKVCCDCHVCLDNFDSIYIYDDYTGRCNYTKVIEKLDPVIEILQKIYNRYIPQYIPSNVIIEADKLYLEITKGIVHRQNPRKSLIFSCLMKSFEKLEIDIDKDEILSEIFSELNLTNDKLKKGLMFLKDKYGYDL